MGEAADVHRASFDERLPWLAGRHTASEIAAFFTERVFAECEVWGAIAEARLLGIVAFREAWIDQLYVLPSAQGAGVGARLLDIVKARQSLLRLWTFQRNDGARAFYEKRGFVEIGRSDGTRNEEREPDALYEWRAA